VPAPSPAHMRRTAGTSHHRDARTTRWRSIDPRSSAMAMERTVNVAFVDGFATCEGLSTLASHML
jgi:hypothetical protein